MSAQRLPWSYFADDPLHMTMRFRGLDLTGAYFKYHLQAQPTAVPLLELTTAGGASGQITLVNVGDDDGVPYTDVEILSTQAAMTAALAGFDLAGKVTLYHKLQWILPDDPDDFTPVDTTIFFGPVTIYGGTNG